MLWALVAFGALAGRFAKFQGTPQLSGRSSFARRGLPAIHGPLTTGNQSGVGAGNQSGVGAGSAINADANTLDAETQGTALADRRSLDTARRFANHKENRGSEATESSRWNRRLNDQS